MAALAALCIGILIGSRRAVGPDPLGMHIHFAYASQRISYMYYPVAAAACQGRAPVEKTVKIC